MVFKNKTNQTQQINLVDGSSEIVQPFDSKDVDKRKIYTEEIDRLKKFFDFGDQKVEKPKVEKKEERKKEKSIFGGDE